MAEAGYTGQKALHMKTCRSVCIATVCVCEIGCCELLSVVIRVYPYSMCLLVYGMSMSARARYRYSVAVQDLIRDSLTPHQG